MDLRIVKTRHQIVQALLRLRDKILPGKIKVKDICDEAKINKTTFYKHYADYYALSDEIDNAEIEKLLEGFSGKHLIFEDTRAYIDGLYRALDKSSDNLRRVFKGRTEVLCARLEEKLLSYYSEEDIKEKGIILSFIIGGFVKVVKDYLFKDDQKESVESLTDKTVDIVNTVIDMTEN